VITDSRTSDNEKFTELLTPDYSNCSFQEPSLKEERDWYCTVPLSTGTKVSEERRRNTVQLRIKKSNSSRGQKLFDELQEQFRIADFLDVARIL
jgi:hypothetical protein